MARSKGYTKIEALKRGRFRGTIYETASGKRVYMALRRQVDMVLAGEKNGSAAIRAGVAAWGLDEETAMILRTKSVEYAGILVRGTGDKYVTRLDAFFDPKQVQPVFSRRFHSQRCLPLTAFRYRPGRVRL